MKTGNDLTFVVSVWYCSASLSKKGWEFFLLDTELEHTYYLGKYAK